MFYSFKLLSVPRLFCHPDAEILTNKGTVASMQLGGFVFFQLPFHRNKYKPAHENGSGVCNSFLHQNTSQKRCPNNVVYWFRLSFPLFDYNYDFFCKDSSFQKESFCCMVQNNKKGITFWLKGFVLFYVVVAVAW